MMKKTLENMKKKLKLTTLGFTLIELLAIIIIIGIIAVIAVPTVKNLTEDAKKKAFINTARGIIKAGDLYYSRKDMNDEINGDMKFTFPNNAEELELQGKLPENGEMTINEHGDIELIIYNKDHCITKGYNDKDITITDDVKKCTLSKDSIGPALMIDQELGTSSEHPAPADSETYLISGTVNDDSGIKSLTVNGTKVSINNDGSWNITLVLTKDVVTEVKVIATDIIENTTEKIGYVLYAEYTEVSVGKTSYAEEIGYSDTVTNLVIPATFQKDEKWYKVTGLTDEAFYNCTSLTNVNIPNSVTGIGLYAFSGCTSLISINIPNSVTSISSYVFSGCTNLTNVTFGENSQLTSFALGAFSNCTSLTSINIPNSVTSISSSAFYNCTSLTNVNIPNSVTSISSSAFYNCTSLTSINIPASVTNIKNSAFSECTNLTNVTFDENSQLTTIDMKAFTNCTSLTTINIPNSVTGIVISAFSGCTNLTNVTFGENSQLINIGKQAFSDCTSLTSINIPNSVTRIGTLAFSNCTSLTSINIPNGMTSIEKYAFSDCSKLTSVTFDNTNGWYVADTSEATSGTDVDVTDASVNSTNLKSTYNSKYWYRAVSE